MGPSADDSSPLPRPLLSALQFFLKSSLCCVSFETKQLKAVATVPFYTYHLILATTLR